MSKGLGLAFQFPRVADLPRELCTEGELDNRESAFESVLPPLPDTIGECVSTLGLALFLESHCGS